MTIFYLPPTQEDAEPVYLYDNCAEHPIELNGTYIDQKMVARIRSMIVTPRDLDRLCRVPLLAANDNNGYRNMWEGGGLNTFQRMLNLENVGRLIQWWGKDTTVSPNTPIAWLPANIDPFQEQANSPASMLTLNPQLWCVQECVLCGATSQQFDGHEAGLWFDNCRQCAKGALRPGFLIDGQHRTRGMAQPGTGYHEQKIFCSMVSAQNPQGVNLDDAARMFIEVNGGAAPLDRLHENFLASHFRIQIPTVNYSDGQKRAAFNISAKLNAPAMRKWSQDNGLNPRIGRVTLMPGGATMDYLPSWRIEEAVLTELMGVGVAVPALGGAGLSEHTPLTWSANPDHSVDPTCHILRDYLTAIFETWTGAGGVAGVMPAWCTNRSQEGNLQHRGVMRLMLRLLPSVLARIEEQGNARNVAEMKNELQLISNVSFDDGWMTFIHGDTGIDRMERVLERILRTAAYPGGGPAWANIQTWAFDQHDPIQIINATASTDGVSFSTQTTCAMDPTIQTRVSLVGARSALVTIKNTNTGDQQIWDGFRTQFGGNQQQSVDFADLGMANATPGQDIEIEIQLTTAMNNTRVNSPVAIATVV